MMTLPRLVGMLRVDGNSGDDEVDAWMENVLHDWDVSRMELLLDALAFARVNCKCILRSVELLSPRRVVAGVMAGRTSSVRALCALLMRHAAAGQPFWEDFANGLPSTQLSDAELSAVWEGTEAVWPSLSNMGLLQNVALHMHSFVFARKMMESGLYQPRRNLASSIIWCLCREAVEQLITNEGHNVEKGSSDMTYCNLYYSRSAAVVDALIDLGADPRHLLSNACAAHARDTLPPAQVLEWVLDRMPDFGLTSEHLLFWKKAYGCNAMQYAKLLKFVDMPQGATLERLKKACVIVPSLGKPPEKVLSKRALKKLEAVRRRENVLATAFREMSAALFTLGLMATLPDLETEFAWPQKWFEWRPHTHRFFPDLRERVFVTLLCLNRITSLPRDIRLYLLSYMVKATECEDN